jgi:hypothetical protein
LWPRQLDQRSKPPKNAGCLAESEFLSPALLLGIDDVDDEELPDLDSALGYLDALLRSVHEEAQQLPAIAGAVLLFDFWLLHEHRSIFTEVAPARYFVSPIARDCFISAVRIVLRPLADARSLAGL